MSRDSSIVPNADTFDAFRWCYGSDSSTSSPKSFVTISETHMHFGFGRQACPGRVFAATAMKIVLSRFLLDYEVVFEDHGETKKQRPTRPSNIVNGEQILPSFRATVLIRKRRG